MKAYFQYKVKSKMNLIKLYKALDNPKETFTNKYLERETNLSLPVLRREIAIFKALGLITLNKQQKLIKILKTENFAKIKPHIVFISRYNETYKKIPFKY